MDKEQLNLRVPSPPDFHHVTLAVDKVHEAAFFRDDQNLKAMVTVKMKVEDVRSLYLKLGEYLAAHQEGADLFMYTLEGRFT